MTASVFSADGRQLNVTVTWVSSDANVARVQDGQITASRVGTATITASAGGVTSSGLSVGVTPGPAAQLGIRTQPAGAAVAIAFTTQPVVEIRDAAGNLATSSVLAVTVSIASGGGTLGGASSVSAVAGVATFVGLTLSGVAGSRTLSFAATGLTTLTSEPFALAPGNPAQLVIRTQPIGGAIGALLLTQPVIELRDVSGNVATGSSAAVNAALSFGAGTLSGATTINAAAGVATFRDLVISGPVGDRELSFSMAGLPLVSSARFALELVVYGTPAQKIQIIDVGAAVTPLTSAGTPPTFTSRTPSRASVDNTGRITARAEGQAWIVSNIAGGGDSVLAIVPRSATGPVIRTNLTRYYVSSTDSTVIDFVLDPRATPVGAVSLFASVREDASGVGYPVFPLQASGVQVVTSNLNIGIYRFSIAASGPISGPIAFGRLTLRARQAGLVVVINLVAIDAYGPDGADIYPGVTSTVYTVLYR